MSACVSTRGVTQTHTKGAGGLCSDASWISAPADRIACDIATQPLTGLNREPSEVPVVDLGLDDDAASEAFFRAATEVGFLYVTNHGVPDSVLTEQFRESAAFFSQPQEDKLALQSDSSNRGYHPPGLGTAKNLYKQADRKEAINLYLGFETDDIDRPFHGRNRWPDTAKVPGFRPAMTAHYQAMEAVSQRLLRLTALGLQLPADYFADKFDCPTSNVRAIHYLPGAHSAEVGIFGVGAHTDWGVLTVLAMDDTPGLQIRHQGVWQDVPPRKGALVVNIGDMLHRWTGGRFRSTLHRVVKMTPGERYSTPFFCAPNWDATVKVLPGCDSEEAVVRYPPVTAGEWLMKRRAAEYGAKQQLQIT